jgi:hypothetical protein
MITYWRNILGKLIVIGPRDKAPEGFTVVNTTSKDRVNIGFQLSPFFLGPIPLYEGKFAQNLENAWQFSKVYKEFADVNNQPTQKYFNWAIQGWTDSYAHRYPNGKGAIPLYSYWKVLEDGKWVEKFWGYVDARKNIYFPLYAKAIVKTSAYQQLSQRLENGENIALWDFDGYDHAARNMTYEDVVNSPKYKCGHAFVIYGLLTKQLKIENDILIYNFI